MKFILHNFKAVNEGEVFEGFIIIDGGCISRIIKEQVFPANIAKGDEYHRIDLKGNYLFPGVIDAHVHFREPGLTYKGDLVSESRAAVAGGITSFMEMPNTIPNVTTRKILEEKHAIAAEKSIANYSFFIGATNDNVEELLKIDPQKVCGIKLFLGSSTGNMIVDNVEILNKIFSESPVILCAHCEDEATIKKNEKYYRDLYGENVPAACHPLIRSEEACYKSSAVAVELAEKKGSRLHLAHISTKKELGLLRNDIHISEKRITGEACIHHLWFNDTYYEGKGNFIKWNPAIKTEADRQALFEGVINDTVDIIATDHAPHSLAEKEQNYRKAPSGGPLVQHCLPAMLEFHLRGKISLEKIVEKMCHHPAILYQVKKRGFLREGYYADLVVVDLNSPWMVDKSNILYRCGWSPFDGETFGAKVTHTLVNGNLVFEEGVFHEGSRGQRLLFER